MIVDHVEDLAKLARALDIAGTDASDIVPLFITVDPARDTVDLLSEYVGAFHERLVGLTGDDGEIAMIAAVFKVQSHKSNGFKTDPDYLMEHTSIVYLVGRDGTVNAFFDHQTSANEIAGRIGKTVSGTAR